MLSITNRLYLREDLNRLWGRVGSISLTGKDGGDDTAVIDLPLNSDFNNAFDSVMALEGEVYREVKDRRTLRCLSSEIDATQAHDLPVRAYFAKFHSGVGWWEICKNWLNLKRPVLGARNEYRACLHLAEHNIAAPRVAGFGERGWNPARRQSFVICDAVEPSESLETVCRNWHRHSPDQATRQKFIYAVADLARAIHASGCVHRDFYICHFLLDSNLWRQQKSVELTVIDLHRALLFKRIPRRWLVRDLAACLFSTLDCGLSRRDWLRFVRRYRGNRDLREIFAEEGALWEAVYRRAMKLYSKGVRRGLAEGYYYESRNAQRHSQRESV